MTFAGPADVSNKFHFISITYGTLSLWHALC
jgi:hypothetical protein